MSRPTTTPPEGYGEDAEPALLERTVGRRRVLQWSGALAGATALGLPQAAHASARKQVKAPPTPDPTTFAQADSLVEAMGARINTQLASSSYGNPAAVRDAVAYVGLRYCREETVAPSFNPTMAKNQQIAWPMLASVGCRMITIMAKADGSEASVASLAAYHKSQFGGDTGGVLWGIENANEWNGIRGCGVGSGISKLTGVRYSDTYPQWAEQLAVWQRSMWRSYATDPQLDGLAIVGPALVNATPGNSGVLVSVANTVYGNNLGIQQFLTHTNYHVYPGQAAGLSQPSVPSWHLDQKVSAMAVQGPNRPYVCTESGMHNALNSTNTNFSAHSQTAANIYGPRMTLEHLLRGATRQWFFALADDEADPNLDDQDNAFGLFNFDWTPKPVATAWKRLVAIFADPGPAFTPTPISLTVTGSATMGPGLHSLRFQKRDGTTLLALWRDVSVWDYVTQTDTPVDPQTATVALAVPATVRSYRPSIADGVFANLGTAVSSIDVPLTGDVVILAIN